MISELVWGWAGAQTQVPSPCGLLCVFPAWFFSLPNAHPLCLQLVFLPPQDHGHVGTQKWIKVYIFNKHKHQQNRVLWKWITRFAQDSLNCSAIESKSLDTDSHGFYFHDAKIIHSSAPWKAFWHCACNANSLNKRLHWTDFWLGKREAFQGVHCSFYCSSVHMKEHVFPWEYVCVWIYFIESIL